MEDFNKEIIISQMDKSLFKFLLELSELNNMDVEDLVYHIYTNY